MSKFKIGDDVYIKERGHIYAYYRSMFIKLGFDDIDHNGITNDSGFNWVVIDIVRHDDTNKKIYVIEDKRGNKLLIDKKGLKLDNYE